MVIRDLFHVTDLHTLIISKWHAETYFNLSDVEPDEMRDILRRGKRGYSR